MAANKNQHFVPRCYLRPFSEDGAGKVINLFNLDRNTAISSAPTKGQCSGNYFYGEDLQLEKRLQAFEGLYAARKSAILKTGYRLTDDDGAIFRHFWLLQYMRTDAAARAMVSNIDAIQRDLGALPAGYSLTIKEAVQTAMQLFFDDINIVDDLGIRLIRNCTATSFITSDNPAVMTNRWHLTDRRTQLIGPGLQSAGMTGYLPISPTVACVLYDRGLYMASHKRGWIDIDKVADIDSINEHQVLNCQANLYFNNWDDRAKIADLVARVCGARLQERYKLTYAILDHQDSSTKTFRAIDALTARAHEDCIVYSALTLPTPTRWSTMIGWRANGVAFDSKTGAGFSRKHTRVAGIAYTKVKRRT